MNQSLPIKRIAWIDLLRGFCMMCILWFHTEMHFCGHEITPYSLYVGNVLAVFFFLSGYLFYSQKPVNIRYKLYRILRSLVIPYFIFSTLMALPKAFIHHESIDIISIAQEILLGKASWFVPALIVAELLFIAILCIPKRRNMFIIILSILMLLLSFLIGNRFNPSPLIYSYNIWHINEALLGCSFMAFGYMYHHIENIINTKRNIYMMILLLIAVMIVKYMVLTTCTDMVFGPIIVSNYPLFIIDLILTTILLVNIFQFLPNCKIIQWTGSHCLVYYFICGAIPLLTSKLLHTIGVYSNNYIMILMVFLLVYLIATMITWIIYKYFHWIVGR